MTTIGLVRHGVTDWNAVGRIQGQTNTTLNDEGRKQAELLGERLAGQQWDLIIASDLTRAWHTAEIINERLGVPILSDARLREVNFGEVEGTTSAERIARWGEDWRDQDVGREKQEIIDERITAAIHDILAEHAGKSVLVVSHGALIINCLRLFVPQLDTSARLNNASLTVISYADERWDCSLYNCTNHLNES